MLDLSYPRLRPIGLAVGIALLIGLVHGGTSALGRQADSLSGGHLGLSCGACHASTDAAGGETGVWHMTRQEAICADCHEGTREASHPVGFSPTRPLPTALPLAANGTMTCSTCHDLHGEQPGFLRPALAGQGTCMSCHDTAFYQSMADRGQSVIGRAHLDASGTPWNILDPYSRQCLICHDDKGPDRLQTASLSPAIGHVTGTGNHPIGHSYQQAAEYGGYRPVFDLAEDILLPGGRVGCVSCHQPYSRQHGSTVETPAGLCVECHSL